MAALDGWIEANCVKKDNGSLSDDDVFTLRDMMRRFPDGERESKGKDIPTTPAMAKELLGG